MTVEIDDRSQSPLTASIASFQTTVIKASYAPLLLDHRFKDLQENDIITFLAGSNKIDKNGREILIRYGELLREHPGLSLLITGLADAQTDRNILLQEKEALEQQRVEIINARKLAEYRKKQKALAAVKPTSKLKEENIAKEDLAGYTPLLPNPVTVSDDILLELAKERGLLVYDFCLHSLGISAERLLISKKASILDTSRANGARIEIKSFLSSGD